MRSRLFNALFHRSNNTQQNSVPTQQIEPAESKQTAKTIIMSSRSSSSKHNSEVTLYLESLIQTGNLASFQTALQTVDKSEVCHGKLILYCLDVFQDHGYRNHKNEQTKADFLTWFLHTENPHRKQFIAGIDYRLDNPIHKKIGFGFGGGPVRIINHYSAVELACINDDLASFKLLLEATREIHLKPDLAFILKHSIECKHTELTEYLLSSDNPRLNETLNIFKKNSEEIIHFAVDNYCNIEIFKNLFVNSDYKKINFANLLEHVCSSSSDHILRWLVCADNPFQQQFINEIKKHKDCPYLHAAMNRSNNSCILLLESGAQFLLKHYFKHYDTFGIAFLFVNAELSIQDKKDFIHFIKSSPSNNFNQFLYSLHSSLQFWSEDEKLQQLLKLFMEMGINADGSINSDAPLYRETAASHNPALLFSSSEAAVHPRFIQIHKTMIERITKFDTKTLERTKDQDWLNAYNIMRNMKLVHPSLLAKTPRIPSYNESEGNLSVRRMTS